MQQKLSSAYFLAPERLHVVFVRTDRFTSLRKYKTGNCIVSLRRKEANEWVGY